MTDFLPDLRQALVARSDALAVPRTRTKRSAIRVVAPLFAGLLFTGSALAAGHAAGLLWAPSVGDDSEVIVRSATAVPAEQLNLLQVLRRPQNVTDRGPESQASLKLVRSYVKGLRVHSVRLLGADADGAGFVLVSAERLAHDRRIGGGPDRRDPLCLFANGVTTPSGQRTGGASFGCWTTEQIARGEAGGEQQSAASSNGKPLHIDWYGLVADGVTGVTVSVGGQRVFAPVVNNWYTARLHNVPADARAMIKLKSNGE